MLRSVLSVILTASLVFGATPIATVTAAKSVTINGVNIGTQGVPTWPLVSGDVIKTADEPAVISLPDGSRFILDKNSIAKIQQCGAIEVQSLQGVVNYRFAAGSKAEICAVGRPVKPASLVAGSVTIETPDKAVVRTPDQRTVDIKQGGCLCSPKKLNKTAIIVVVGVTALALAIGLGLALPSAVSPSTP